MSKRLIRTIVLAALITRSKPRQGKTPRPENLFLALEKPLAAEQLFRSILIATQEPSRTPLI